MLHYLCYSSLLIFIKPEDQTFSLQKTHNPFGQIRKITIETGSIPGVAGDNKI